MHISVGMTVHFFLNGFSSCTFLYEWLSISFWMGFRHAHLCTNDYPFLCGCVYGIDISVRMTIHIHIGFCHAHFCTNDYPYSFVFFVMHIFVRMTICSQFLSNAFLLRALPHLFWLYDDCTRNHTLKSTIPTGSISDKKSLLYQEGIYRIILWKFLFLANCIVRNQQL